MKLIVVNEANEQKVVDLEGDCQITEGQHLNCIHDSGGADHYFTKDGFYDGWGGKI